MTRDDIIRLAREASSEHDYDFPNIFALERFAALIAAAEREAQTRAYYKGLREGVSNYAYWRDGVQHVGTTGRTLKEAIGDIDREEKDLLKRYGVE
jgi:hypothetical protein